MDPFDQFGFNEPLGHSNKLHEKFTIDDIEDFEEAFWEWT